MSKHRILPCGNQPGNRHRWDVGDRCLKCGEFREDVMVERDARPFKVDVSKMPCNFKKAFYKSKINPGYDSKTVIKL